MSEDRICLCCTKQATVPADDPVFCDKDCALDYAWNDARNEDHEGLRWCPDCRDWVTPELTTVSTDLSECTHLDYLN